MTRRQTRLNYLYRIVGVVLAITLGPLALGGDRVEADTLTGLTSTGHLVTFDSSTPGTIGSNLTITGLLGGETILGIDRRPATGLLYGLGSSSRIYTINTATGTATAVGTPFSPVLSGMAFGFDFNPVVDRIRIVSTDASNFRLNPNDGTVAGADVPVSYGSGDSGSGIAPRVVGTAYTNNFNGAAITTLFGIDANRDVLVMQGGPNGVPSPNGGVLTTIGSGLGFNTSDLVGFDISGSSGIAFASLTPVTGGASQLFTINLTTGAAMLSGTIGNGLTLTGLSADVGSSPAVPEPSSLVLIATGLCALFTLGRPTGTT